MHIEIGTGIILIFATGVLISIHRELKAIRKALRKTGESE